MISKDQAIIKIQQQIAAMNHLRSLELDDSVDFEIWHRDTEIVITNIFGTEPRNLNDFKQIKFAPDPEKIEKYLPPELVFKDGLDLARAILESMIREIEDYWPDELESASRNVLFTIQKICERFHLVVSQLRSRHNNRDSFNVEDEYDVQDLFHALLTVEFDDIRPEEWTPSYAGAASRTDFLLKQEQVVIEVKKTRKGLTAREVGEQLIIDIQRYKTHPNCRSLVCFVYDPEGRIANPRGLENDLSLDGNDMPVKVIITPR